VSCPHRAVLIITREVQHTSTSLARKRIELQCNEAAGHAGPHRDSGADESWKDRGEELTHLLRSEKDS
jgi:hypothetical protein